jgi:lysozyme
MKGVDVSHWNPVLNWPAIKAAGYDFAFIKATEPANYMPPNGVDDKFAVNATGAQSAGMLWGPYHFWRYGGTGGPEGQIDAFLASILPGPTCKYIVLDIEDTAAPKKTLETLRRLARSIVYLESRLPAGYEVLLYSARWWWDAWIGNDDVTLADGSRVVFSKWPLWVAHYTENPDIAPMLPLTGSWVSYLFYQYTSKGNIPNSGDPTIDLNFTRLTLDQIRHGAAPPPPLTLEDRVARLEAEARLHGWNVG